MKLLFAGSGEFGIPSFEALCKAGHEIALVVTQPDRPAGRGRHLTPTPIAQLAIKHGLPLLRTQDINKENPPAADLMVVIAFGQKIAPHQVDHARLGAINLHGSRLPKFRGAGPVNAAIIAGETMSGNSVIRLAEKMDAGAILGQSQIEIGELETAAELHDRLAADGAPLLLDVITQLENGRAIETPQDHASATLAPKLNRRSAQIDWSRTADQIAGQIRGMYPWPGCHVRLIAENGTEHGRAALVRARACSPFPDAAMEGAGSILSDGSVMTRTGALQIIEIQPEGKRPMPLAAFRNGHPWQTGMRLEST